MSCAYGPTVVFPAPGLLSMDAPSAASGVAKENSAPSLSHKVRWSAHRRRAPRSWTLWMLKHCLCPAGGLCWRTQRLYGPQQREPCSHKQLSGATRRCGGADTHLRASSNTKYNVTDPQDSAGLPLKRASEPGGVCRSRTVRALTTRTFFPHGSWASVNVYQIQIVTF